MNKVMTRTPRRPGTRPPGRQDPRRPGSTPPRAPGGGTPRTPPEGSPPPKSPTGNTSPATPLATSGPATPLANRRPTTPTTGRPPASLTDSRPPAVPTATRPQATPLRSRPRTTTPATGAPPLSAPSEALRGPTPGQTLQRPAHVPQRPAPQPRPTDLFADLLLAVLSGQRPVHCMLRHTAGRAYDELAWLAERGLLRTRGTRPVVRDIGYYVPRPGAIEAFARIGAGDQLRAMAFRLEQAADLRWRCTAVELGGPRMPHTDDD
ncbi:Rv3235 family protein [Streptomyces sp. NPDC050535]|uniref:Rv3235 family protein n=1 Tax=Streptomyces sp. NPDC050535 TaxID=3365626 RepID=UPI0037BA8CC2